MVCKVRVCSRDDVVELGDYRTTVLREPRKVPEVGNTIEIGNSTYYVDVRKMPSVKDWRRHYLKPPVIWVHEVN